MRIYDMKSKDYNEQFSALEDSFLSGQSDSSAMYLMICDKLRAMVFRFARLRNICIDSEEVDDIVQDGAIWFLAQYERAGFRVKKFTSYIVYAFRKSMFNEKRKKQEMGERALLKDLNEKMEM